MSETLVTVVRDPFRRSWPELDKEKPVRRDEDRAYLLGVGRALERSYTTDAHFTAYATPTGFRCNSETVDYIPDGVPMAILCFDIDGPGHGVTPEWRAETRGRVQAMFESHPDGFYYETRGGCRLVYRLPELTFIRSTEAAAQWARDYAVAIAYLRRRFGIEADPACSDWQRHYRLPRATREGSTAPENHPTFGDATAIGTLLIEATHDDRLAAERASIAWRPARTSTVDHSVPAGGRGLFWHLLHRRGLLRERRVRGGQISVCPNAASHSSVTDGRSATLVFPPSPGHTLGVIKCMHAHCAIGTAQWLALFSEAEIAEAERAAGLRQRAKRAA